MSKYICIALIALAITLGCAARSPVTPHPLSPDQAGGQVSAATQDGPHRLWGEWRLFFNAERTQVDVVPRRQGRFHLNATKILETLCGDCLEITKIHNNGDGTINLTVRIKHPFPGHPEFTGFDVKGIIMFNGSHYLNWDSEKIFPYYDQFLVSWREAGDPEVLNADGYTPRWSPWWDSGSSMPIFSYWPGKYSNGTPTANVNAFLNFYTDEQRHMFTVNGQVECTYHIYLPPGPVVAGYAIDACWEPPTVTPVLDPLNDFPISANQVEPYHCRFVINNDEVITHSPCCGFGPYPSCEDLRVETRKWYGENARCGAISRPPPHEWPLTGLGNMEECEKEPPTGEMWWAPPSLGFTQYDNGYYRGMAVILSYQDQPGWPPPLESVSYDVFDFTIDLD